MDRYLSIVSVKSDYTSLIEKKLFVSVTLLKWYISYNSLSLIDSNI